MDRVKKIFALAMLVLIMTLGIFAARPLAQNAPPGSSEDPLVSRSYVDSQIDRLIAMMNTGGGGEAQEWEQAAAFAPVRAEKGQLILGGEGSEMILRSGRASGLCGGENGLVDATAGAEVHNGGEIQINHLILVPRDDGRGVTVVSGEAWFIIKGGYQIVTP